MPAGRSTFLLAFACSAAVFAAVTGAWQNKDFKDWTDKDAAAIMSDSPWAKQMPMPANGRPNVMVVEPGNNGAPPPSAALGNPSSTTTGVNMTSPAYPGSTGPADPNGTHTLSTTQSQSGVAPSAGAPVHQAPITVIWASATPVRLAMLKVRSGSNSPDETRVANAHKPGQNYVIIIHGLPEPEAGSDPKELANFATLRVKNKAPLTAHESGYWSGPGVYFFRFHKSSLPITAADGQVEFKMTMGQIEIKKKFELKDMQYQGQLAL